MPRRRRPCRTTTPIVGRDWKKGSIRPSRSGSFFPSPLVGRVDQSRVARLRRVRGLSPRKEPLIRRNLPPVDFATFSHKGRRKKGRAQVTIHPNDPKLRSFIPVAPTSDFPIQNLPYGIFSAKD